MNSGQSTPSKASLTADNTFLTKNLYGNGQVIITNQELRNLINELRKEVNEMQTAMEFISNKFDEQVKNNKLVRENLELVRKENIYLKNEINSMKNIINAYETEKISKNLVISGICEDPNENLEYIKKKSIQVLNYIDNSITEKNITKVKKVPTKNRLPVVVVTMDEPQKKIDILAKKKNKKQIDMIKCKINVSKNTRIYINEEMTKHTYTCYKESLKLKEYGFQFVWQKNGHIYARQNPQSEQVRIRDTLHLQEILNEL